MTDVPESPYYHGTDPESAANLIENGIRESALQDRDRGFYGEGFYMTSRFNTARNYGEAVVEIQFPDGGILSPHRPVDVKNERGGLEDGSVKVDGRPLDWRQFSRWIEQKVRDAAVWEVVDTDKSPEEIVQNAINEADPEHEDFDRLDYYPDRTAYAEYRGFEVVYWADTEIVLVDFDAPERLVPGNEAAEEAVEDAL